MVGYYRRGRSLALALELALALAMDLGMVLHAENRVKRMMMQMKTHMQM